MKDRIVEHPARYQLVPIAGTADQFDLMPVPGIVTEEGDNINKANFLPDNVAALLGLTGNPQVADALSKLSGAVHPLQYVWEKYAVVYGEVLGAKVTEYAADAPSLNNDYTFYTSLSFSGLGVITGNGAYTETLSRTSNYKKVGYFYSAITSKWYKLIDESTNNITFSGTQLILTGYPVTSALNSKGSLLNEEASFSDSTYPQNGIQGGYFYVYRGRPKYIGSRPVTGSYTGTGTYGVNNPNSITLPFVPKRISLINSTGVVFGELIINGSTVYGYSYASSFSALVGSISGNTVSWYSASSAAAQLNASGVAYLYEAEG